MIEILFNVCLCHGACCYKEIMILVLFPSVENFETFQFFSAAVNNPYDDSLFTSMNFFARAHFVKLCKPMV